MCWWNLRVLNTDSKLSCDRYSRHDGKLVVRIRLTEEDDVTASKGLDRVLALVKPYIGKVPVFLWGSLPCTLGSPWQNLNCHKPGWAGRSNFLRDQLVRLHDNFMKLATFIARHADGHVCYE